MEPAIAPGQVVVVQRPAGETTDGRYILHGDNSGGSLDSRHYGAVSPSDILGRVVFIGPQHHR